MRGSPSVIVRDAARADAAAIAAIYDHYVMTTPISFEEMPVGADTMAERIAEVLAAGYPYLAAERDGDVIGFSYASRFRRRAAYLHTVETTIYVAADATRGGVGTALYSELFERLGSMPVHAAMAGIALPNPASVALHERFGFAPVGRFPEIGRKFDQWVDVGYWHRFLD